MDKYGTFAQTMAERFPFGMRHKYIDPAMRFNWGGLFYDHQGNWLAHNELLLDWFKEISTAKGKENRIVDRQVQQQIELDWRFYLVDLKRFLHKVSYDRFQAAHADMVRMYFDRVEDRFAYNQKLFMNIQIEGIEHTKKVIVDSNLKIKKNPHRDEIKFPGEHSFEKKISDQIHENLETRRETRATRDEVTKVHAELKEQSMMRQLAAHELAYSYQARVETNLVYINDKHIALRRRLFYRARFAPIQPGAIGHGLRVKRNNI